MATLDIFSILLPLKTTFLLFLIDASTICCILCILDAKVATITLPLALLIILSNVNPMLFSDRECPCLSTLVLSAINKAIPSFPRLDILCKSIFCPSIGV